MNYPDEYFDRSLNYNSIYEAKQIINKPDQIKQMLELANSFEQRNTEVLTKILTSTNDTIFNSKYEDYICKLRELDFVNYAKFPSRCYMGTIIENENQYLWGIPEYGILSYIVESNDIVIDSIIYYNWIGNGIWEPPKSSWLEKDGIKAYSTSTLNGLKYIFNKLLNNGQFITPWKITPQMLLFGNQEVVHRYNISNKIKEKLSQIQDNHKYAYGL